MAGIIVLTQRGQNALRESAPPGTEFDMEMLEGISFLEGMRPDEIQVQFTVDATRFRASLRRLQEAGFIEIIPEEQIDSDGQFVNERPVGLEPEVNVIRTGSFFRKPTPDFVQEEF